MMEPVREELLRVLAELSEACPDYRFGQMMANLVFLSRGDVEGATWNIEDDELLDAARKHLSDWNARHAAVDARH